MGIGGVLEEIRDVSNGDGQPTAFLFTISPVGSILRRLPLVTERLRCRETTHEDRVVIVDHTLEKHFFKYFMADPYREVTGHSLVSAIVRET